MYLPPQLIKKIYKKGKQEALKDILIEYNNKGFVTVNFLYFFNLLKIIEKKSGYEQYLNSLIESDFILPDGIALRLFFKKKYNINLENLNGTDFIPYFLNNLSENFITYLYGAKKEVIEKVVNKYGKKWNIKFYQNGYEELNWDNLKDNLTTSKIKIVLVGLGTPKQETWIQENLDYIKKYGFIVFGVGGLFDFLSGEEKRAPYIIRKLNLERLWRALTKPKKNLKKTIGSFKLFRYLILK